MIVYGTCETCGKETLDTFGGLCIDCAEEENRRYGITDFEAEDDRYGKENVLWL